MICEGSHIVRFVLNDKGFVEIKGCPYKWDTNLRIISLNDILESKDILSFLKEVHSYNYEDKKHALDWCFILFYKYQRSIKL
mgnify:CR=1 FL=1